MSVTQLRPEQPSPAHEAGTKEAYLDVLNQLIDIGTAFAQLLLEEAKAQAAPPREDDKPGKAEPPPEDAPASPARNAAPLAIAYERVARAVRRSILLAQKLGEATATAASPTQDRTAARKRIIRVVEDAIQLKSKDPEADNAEFLDRLDSVDLDEELLNRSIKEIVTDIVRDLGLAHMPGTHPWKRRTPADIAELRTRAAKCRGLGPEAPAGQGQSP